MLLTVSCYSSSSSSSSQLLPLPQHLEECLVLKSICSVTWDRGIIPSGFQFSQWEIEALTRREIPNFLLKTPQRLPKLSLNPWWAETPNWKYHWTQKAFSPKNSYLGVPVHYPRWPWIGNCGIIPSNKTSQGVK